MTPENKAEYYKLAQEVMEPVLTVAARRLGLAVEEIHSTQIKPLRKASSAMLAALKYLVAECDQDMDQAYNPHAAPLARAHAAIAQAEAAGIEETE